MDAVGQVRDWLGPDGPIAAALDGYEQRPEQVEMAAAVVAALDEQRHLAIEAGTGVGKTFGYLLPAIQLVQSPGRRVVVSTHTIALQEQLFKRDLPFLQRVLDVPFTAELVKGRNNYVGLRRLKLASERQQSVFSSSHHLKILHAIEDWAYRTEDGSLADLDQMPPGEVWEKVRSEHGNCLGRRCPNYEPCFYQRARRRAEQAQILVVNHALLMADLVLREDGANVLPNYDAVILDEAHMVDHVATDMLGLRVTNVQVHYLLSSLFNDRTQKGYLASLGSDTQKRTVVAASSAATEFFHTLHNWQEEYGRSNGRVVRENVIENRLSQALDDVQDALEPLKKELPRTEDQVELQSYLDRANQAARGVESLLEQKLGEHVYWVEEEQRGGLRVTFSAAPLDPGPWLRQHLFDKLDSVVLTSATLVTGGAGDFEYVLRRFGDPPARTVQLGSPFDYARQVTVHLEAGLPEPGDAQRYLPAASAAISYYARQTEGRAFVLCTSYAMLKSLSESVGDDLSGEDYTILVQGDGMNRTQMLDRFRATPRCVLFGTDSFWQGVDVVGAALSNVMIVKLPFTVPDRPTVEARIDLIRQRHENPFASYQLPEAILKFRQGFGRLIRSHSDRGIVVLLDPRLKTKRYGQDFLRSLPECEVEISMRDWAPE